MAQMLRAPDHYPSDSRPMSLHRESGCAVESRNTATRYAVSPDTSQSRFATDNRISCRNKSSINLSQCGERGLLHQFVSRVACGKEDATPIVPAKQKCWFCIVRLPIIAQTNLCIQPKNQIPLKSGKRLNTTRLTSVHRNRLSRRARSLCPPGVPQKETSVVRSRVIPA